MKTDCLGVPFDERRRQVVRFNRRDFLKLSGATATAAGVAAVMSTGEARAGAEGTFPLKKRVGETSTICCYCSVACGAIVAVEGEEVLNIEGDPDHPINQGTLCSKGQAMAQMHTVDSEINPRRLTHPKYRAAGASDWQDISWNDAITQIATKIKNTRDSNWISTESIGGTDYTVNRTDAIASLGGGENDNEECYLLVKMARALGIVYIEHCARI